MKIDRLETLHKKGYVHRDIKPDNFVIGTGRSASTIHLIDFGVATPYADYVTGVHRPYSDGRELLGTVRYASINAHRGIVHTRRDDLVSLCYVLIYFARGSLPWQERQTRVTLLGKTAGQVVHLKQNTRPDRLCRGLPRALTLLLNHATGLGFEERPDYDYCRTALRQSLPDKEHDGGPQFDWEQHPEQWAGRM